MSAVDILYQKAVDKLTDSALALTVEEFLNIGACGNVEVLVDGEKINVGWNLWKFDEDLHHLVYQTSRKLFWIAYRKYTNGVKLSGGAIVRLTPEEIGNYD